MALTKLTAHRGAIYSCQENTLASFAQAVEDGADRIEFDVHGTRDGYLVIHHDYVLTDAQAPLHQLLLGEVRELNPDVPLLEEALNVIPEEVEVEMELKGFTLEFIKAVVMGTQKMRNLGTVEFTSPHIAVLSALRQQSSELILGQFVAPFPEWMDVQLGRDILLASLELQRINIAHLPVQMIDDALVARSSAAGLALHAANCNSRDDILRALELRVRQLSTDVLPLAKELRIFKGG